MHKETREKLRLRFKLLVLQCITYHGQADTYSKFEIPRSTFYELKNSYTQSRVAKLKRQKPIAFSFQDNSAMRYTHQSLCKSVLSHPVFGWTLSFSRPRMKKDVQSDDLNQRFDKNQDMRHVYIYPRPPQHNDKV